MKQVDTSCVKQSDTPKFIAYVLNGAVSRKYGAVKRIVLGIYVYFFTR